MFRHRLFVFLCETCNEDHYGLHGFPEGMKYYFDKASQSIKHMCKGCQNANSGLVLSLGKDLKNGGEK